MPENFFSQTIIGDYQKGKDNSFDLETEEQDIQKDADPDNEEFKTADYEE